VGLVRVLHLNQTHPRVLLRVLQQLKLWLAPWIWPWAWPSTPQVLLDWTRFWDACLSELEQHHQAHRQQR